MLQWPAGRLQVEFPTFDHTWVLSCGINHRPTQGWLLGFPSQNRLCIESRMTIVIHCCVVISSPTIFPAISPFRQTVKCYRIDRKARVQSWQLRAHNFAVRTHLSSQVRTVFFVMSAPRVWPQIPNKSQLPVASHKAVAEVSKIGRGWCRV